MTIEQAIKKATEFGYEFQRGTRDNYFFNLSDSWVLLDPSFWQCLGRAMGWKDKMYYRPLMPHEIPQTEKHLMEVPSGGEFAANRITGWQVEWHKFISHLAEGKYAESFFEAFEET